MATLQLEDYLPTLEETSPSADGRPLLLPLDRVDEDPGQPRHEFDTEALRELANSIATRGVLQPVSVRRHPAYADRYLLNFGARRLRASRLAGKTEIPAFLDTLASSFDQVIENEHREALRPMELALFVKGQLDAGKSQADVARELGKSRAYISYVCALIDPPDWLMGVYRAGRCRGIKELYDLRRMHEGNPAMVERFVASRGDVARGDIDALREQLAAEASEGSGLPPEATADRLVEAPSVEAPSAELPRATSLSSPRTREHWTVLADAGSSTVEIVLGAVPVAADEVYVVEAGADLRESVKVAALQGLRLQRKR